MKQPLKLYIWEGDGILQDWSSGMIVALAPDLHTAKAAAREAYGMESDWLEESLAQPAHMVRIHDKTTPKAWFVTGGG